MKIFLIYFLTTITFLSCSEKQEAKNESPNPEVVKGTINTFVDGFDVKVVNIWENKTTREKLVTKCYNGDKVDVLKVEGDYIKIKTNYGKIGWCMKDFVKL